MWIENSRRWKEKQWVVEQWGNFDDDAEKWKEFVTFPQRKDRDSSRSGVRSEQYELPDSYDGARGKIWEHLDLQEEFLTNKIGIIVAPRRMAVPPHKNKAPHRREYGLMCAISQCSVDRFIFWRFSLRQPEEVFGCSCEEKEYLCSHLLIISVDANSSSDDERQDPMVHLHTTEEFMPGSWVCYYNNLYGNCNVKPNQ